MKFSSMQLIVDGTAPSTFLFEELLTASRPTHRKGKYLYKIEQGFTNATKDFYWMYFQFDNEHLYADTVLDTENGIECENPRPKSQVEMRNQLFACYDFEHLILYVSDYTKKSVVTEYIQEMTQKTTIVKNIIKSIDEFLAMTNMLKSASFTQYRNIATSIPGSIMQR